MAAPSDHNIPTCLGLKTFERCVVSFELLAEVVSSMDADSQELCVQKVDKLAFAIFVAQSSIENEVKANHWPSEQAAELRASLWWQVMETTRHLLGHPSLGDSKLLLETILGNLGALLKMARVDLSTQKTQWEFLNELSIYYKPPDDRGVVWLSQKEPAKLMAELIPCSYDALFASFEAPISNTGPHKHALMRCRSMFGHAVYRLRATSKAFQEAAHEFKVLRV